MRHVGKKLGFCAAGLKGITVLNHQFVVTDFQFVDGFLTFSGRLLHRMLVLDIRTLNGGSHGIHTRREVLELSG